MLGWLVEFVFLAQTLAQETRKQTHEMESALMAQVETADRHNPQCILFGRENRTQDLLIVSLACYH